MFVTFFFQPAWFGVEINARDETGATALDVGLGNASLGSHAAKSLTTADKGTLVAALEERGAVRGLPPRQDHRGKGGAKRRHKKRQSRHNA